MSERLCLAVLAVLAAVVLYWRWVGYQGHDDASYAVAALDWVQNFPPLGTNHWALRYPLVLPTALIIALFGPSIPALAAVNLVAYLAFLIFSYLAVRYWFGWRAGALLLVLCILLPQFPVQATYANPDMLEMALDMAAFWLLLLARERGAPWPLLLASGLLAGLGFVTRETTVSMLIVFGLLFLFSPGMSRLRYLWIGLGFLTVFGAQTAYLTARTGDPLYRFRFSASLKVDRTEQMEDANRAGRAIDADGVLVTSPVFGPLVVVFVSQKFGLLFYLAVPAYLFARREGRLPLRARRTLDLVGLACAVTFLFVALNARVLFVVPRYFMVPAALATIPVAVLMSDWLGRAGPRRVFAGLACLAFITSSAGLLYLENTKPLRAEQDLVDFAATRAELVYMNPELLRRSRYLLLAQNLLDRVSGDPPAPGSLVAVAEDGFVEACTRSPECPLKARLQPFIPRGDWTPVVRFEPPHRLIASPLASLGIAAAIPPDILKRIVQPGMTAMVYRTPG